MFACCVVHYVCVFQFSLQILNLFVAVIMDNFEYIVWDRSQLGAYDLRIFVKHWSKFDRHGRCVRVCVCAHMCVRVCVCYVHESIVSVCVYMIMCCLFVCLFRGKLRPEKVFDLLRKIDPPVGWGKLCPRVTAYKVSQR